MSQRQSFAFHRSLARFGFVCLVGGLSAACSSDTMRFAETPFSNPFSSSARVEPQTTASVLSAPTAPVQSQALPPVSLVTTSALPPLSAAPVAVASAAPAGLPGGRPVSLPGAKGWTTQGGSSVTLASGETVKTLSNRYGVPEQAIRAANGLTGSAQPAPGASMIIPVYHTTALDAPAQMPAPVAAPVRTAEKPVAPVGSARMQLVKGAQPVATTVSAKATTATSVAAAAPPVSAATRAAKVEAPKAEVAKAAPAKTVAVAKVETKPTPAAQPASVAAKPAAVTAPAAKPVQVAKVEPGAEAVKAPVAPAATTAEPTTTAAISKEAPTDFRWPAKGRVISGFGGKGGASNDGINISLPEGTPVKAAESGTVAYAGSELKGYGNLVLIRHPNGYVTAYAHNGELKVKRGDTVTRGQTIATSGQSGNVSTPQLHFEIRKGSTPVDPLPHLGS
ncbi:MAG: peptidoglycan DD-metalloendopeptidase family protein [Burkholderiales bacterium]|nr:peptidoglycan DD-metalloendopeptidase family protein [Burkholderiales bacterium]